MNFEFYDKRPINNLHETKHLEFIISLIIKALGKNTPSSFVKNVRVVYLDKLKFLLQKNLEYFYQEL